MKCIAGIVYIVMAIVSSSAFAYCTETVNGVKWSYTISEGEASVRGIPTSTSGAVTIPSSLGGYPVTRIDYSAFSGCSGLTSVAIPNSVTRIGYAAFSGCSGLTSIILPFVGSKRGNTGTEDSLFGYIFGEDSYTGGTFTRQASSGSYKIYYIPSSLKSVTITDETSLGYGAFSGCSGLTCVTIDNCVKSIGNRAFEDCSGLTSITLPFVGSKRGNTGTADSLFGYIFGESSTTGTLTWQYYSPYSYSTCYIPKSLKSVTITDETSLGYGAFYGCEGLTNVTIPNSVTNIEDKVFFGCRGLTSMILPFVGSRRGNTGAKDSVFGYVFGSSLYIGGVKVTQCYDGPDNSPSVSYYIPASLKSVEITDETILGYGSFYGCSMLTQILINSNVSKIGGYSFRNCTGISKLSIPSNLKNIECGTFRGASKLQTMDIPFGVTNIAESAFGDCSRLSFVTIPDSVSSIGSSAFAGCNELTSVTIPDSVMSIGVAAFSGCSGLTSVTISDSVTNIGQEAFYACSSLTSIALPGSVARIGYHAFDNYLVFPHEDLNGYLFVGGWLVGFTDEATEAIPNLDEIRGIVGGALEGCTALKELLFSDAAIIKTIDTAALKGCTELQNLVLPPSLEVIGDEAFMGCSYLDNVIVPGSVKSIGVRAFKNCTGFTSAQIEYGVESIGDEAFFGDWQIKEVDIPSTVARIGASAFGGDSSIIRVGLRGDARKISSIFSNYMNIREATIKQGDGKIVDGLFMGCSQLKDVHFQGDCPDLVGNGTNLYNGVKSTLVTYVEETSTGWDGTKGSHQLPQAWPLTGNYRRSIAYWDVPTYLVNFDSSGGTLGVQPTYQYSEKPFALPPEPVQSGYSFAGWWTKRSGGLQVTADTIFIEGVYTTLYAHWVKGHWVFLDPNGGTVTNDFVTYVEQSVYGVLPAAVRTGYAFGGWNYNGMTVLPTTPIATSADHTLTAQWEAYQYSVRYHANGGEGAMDEQILSYDAAEPLTANAFVRRGHAFAGWASSEGGEVAFADGETVENLTTAQNGVVELYAVWEKDGSNVSLTSDGAAAWFMDSANRREEAVSWRSGQIGDGASTVLRAVVNGQGSVSFWWKVDCESFRTYRLDSLAFSIDGEEQEWINGEKDWMQCEHEIEGSGEHILEWVYAKDESGESGDDCGWVGEIVWIPKLKTFNDYLNCTNLEFASDSAQPWFGVRDESHDGFGSLRSGAIGDGAECRIEATVTGEGQISFWWRTDCESSFKSYVLDHLSLLVDGVERCFAYGDSGWIRQTIRVTGGGSHTLSWIYQKDEEGFAGNDCAWLDEVVWTPNASMPVIDDGASDEMVNEVVDSIDFSDAGVKTVIGGVASEYKAFKSWASGVAGGEAAVVASTNAAVSYLLGAERLFANAPKIEFGECEVAADAGEVTVLITVKDGEDAVAVASEKVKEMFEATSDLGDWNSTGKKLTPTVTDLTQGRSNNLNFKVRPGDGTSPRAFLRIRK